MEKQNKKPEEPHTIYTHPEENAPRLREIIDLLDKMIVIVDKHQAEKGKENGKNIQD